jgi:hypothetical protein
VTVDKEGGNAYDEQLYFSPYAFILTQSDLPHEYSGYR